MHHAGYLHKLPNGRWQAYDYHHQPVGGTYSVEYDARVQLANYINKNQGSMPITSGAFVVQPSMPPGLPATPPPTPKPVVPATKPTPPPPPPVPAMTVAPQAVPQGYMGLQSGMHASSRPRKNASGQNVWRIRHPMGGGIGEVIQVGPNQYIAFTRTGQRVSFTTNPSLEIAAQALESFFNLPKVAVPPPVVVPPVAPAPMPPSNAKTSLPVAAKSGDLVWAKQTADAWTITHPQLGVLAVAVKVPGGYQIAIGPGLASHPFYGQDAGILAAMKANTVVKWDTSAKSHVFALLKAANAKAGTLIPPTLPATKKVAVPALKGASKEKLAAAPKKAEERTVIINGYERKIVVTSEGVAVRPMTPRQAIDYLFTHDPKGFLEALRKGAVNRQNKNETDPLMEYLLEKLHADRLPAVLDFDEFWSGLKQSDVVMMRGDTQRSYAHDYRYGKAFWGKGVYGNGTYAATGTLARMKANGIGWILNDMMSTAYQYALNSWQRKKVFPIITGLRWLRGYKPTVIQQNRIYEARRAVHGVVERRLGRALVKMITKGSTLANFDDLADPVNFEVNQVIHRLIRRSKRTVDELNSEGKPSWMSEETAQAHRDDWAAVQELLGKDIIDLFTTSNVENGIDLNLIKIAPDKLGKIIDTLDEFIQRRDDAIARLDRAYDLELPYTKAQHGALESLSEVYATVGDRMGGQLRYAAGKPAKVLGTGKNAASPIKPADLNKFPPEVAEAILSVELLSTGASQNEYGAMAALAGYDAINVPKNSYIVLLNRGALAISEGNYFDLNESTANTTGKWDRGYRFDTSKIYGQLWETIKSKYGAALGREGTMDAPARDTKSASYDGKRWDSELAAERKSFGESIGRWAQQLLPGDREE